MPDLEKTFSQRLLRWARDCDRPMPWKGELDPYKIWLSEIILQQTRVAQGRPYYERFLARFPDLKALAAAEEDEVIRLWQGLGYYTRARNLLRAARDIRDRFGGRFPDRYAQILSLPGIGPYTAAAIASFAFGLPHAVLDGNVIRVLTRIFGIDEAMDKSAGRARLQSLANRLINRKAPGSYNQAIMDLGATVCLPLNPHCPDCPFARDCTAYLRGNPAAYPVKSKRRKKRKRILHYLALEENEKLAIRKREEKDIWRGLYEFPLIESGKALSAKELLNDPLLENAALKGNADERAHLQSIRHELTHQTLEIRFFHFQLEWKKPPPFEMIAIDKLNKFAFPKPIENLLKEKFLYLGLD